MALLGSIMLRPEALFEITDIINADSFYSEKHRVVYETMMELFVKRSPIDLLSVSTKLKEKGLEVSKKSTGEFVKWIQEDVRRENGDMIDSMYLQH